MYAQCVGKLMYQAATVWTDLAFILGMLSIYVHAPIVNWLAMVNVHES
jgi:membrane-anchored glycerophosphoryl diester phosphodiesterase (GDPDase)